MTTRPIDPELGRPRCAADDLTFVPGADPGLDLEPAEWGQTDPRRWCSACCFAAGGRCVEHADRGPVELLNERVAVLGKIPLKLDAVAAAPWLDQSPLDRARARLRLDHLHRIGRRTGSAGDGLTFPPAGTERLAIRAWLELEGGADALAGRHLDTFDALRRGVITSP